ncbi:Protein STAY-GREEN LIKE, chloroplastic, partial [Cucurbita argyrosperma subsp. argyrosperma]
MAFQCASYSVLPSPAKPKFEFVVRKKPVVLCSSFRSTQASYNTLVSEAVRILVPPARFEASKLKVEFSREVKKCAGIIPRTYILSHCDFTANLTLTISDVINLDQLRGWYNKDDVVAEWKKVKDEMCLHVHCYVSGPNSLLDLAADSPKYNRLECWGPLKDAVLGRHHHMQGLLRGSKDVPSPKRLSSPKSIFQALFAFIICTALHKLNLRPIGMLTKCCMLRNKRDATR